MGFFDNYDAAIFDMDGTLIDSMYVWSKVCRGWLIENGRKPADSLEDDIAVITLRQSALYVIKNYDFDLTPEEIIPQWEKMVLAEYSTGVKLKPGAYELVKALKDRGYRLAVATSSFKAGCDAVLGRHGILPFFDKFVFTDEIRDAAGNVLNKSHPELWLETARRLNVPPERCVIFEDMDMALKGGRAAGMGFVAVHEKEHRGLDWKAFASLSDLAVDSLLDVLPLVA